jgi:hypothetical protein
MSSTYKHFTRHAGLSILYKLQLHNISDQR